MNKALKAEKEIEPCTFQPHFYTKEAAVDKLREESFYDYVPKGFKASLIVIFSDLQVIELSRKVAQR